MTLNECINILVIKGAAVGQWLRRLTCTHQAWVQLPLTPIRGIGGSRKDIWPKLLLCTSKSHTSVGMSEPLCKGVNEVKIIWTIFNYIYLLTSLQMGYWHQRADERHGKPPPR